MILWLQSLSEDFLEDNEEDDEERRTRILCINEEYTDTDEVCATLFVFLRFELPTSLLSPF